MMFIRKRFLNMESLQYTILIDEPSFRSSLQTTLSDYSGHFKMLHILPDDVALICAK